MVEKPIQFNHKFVEQLVKEGLSEADAQREAATTMSGAYERPDGTIDAFQTGCNTLRYNENLPPSKGQKEGAAKTSGDLNKFLKESGYATVEEWMAANS